MLGVREVKYVEWHAVLGNGIEIHATPHSQCKTATHMCLCTPSNTHISQLEERTLQATIIDQLVTQYYQNINIAHVDTYLPSHIHSLQIVKTRC